MRKNNRFTLLTLVAIALLCCERPLVAQQATKPATKHSLWKVEGRTNTAYLFGSIHFLTKDFYPLPAPIEAAYKQAEIVVFETDFTEMEAPEAQVKMLQAGQYPPGETLKQQLSKETYTKLDTFLTQRLGIGSAFDQFKPWMVAVMLVGIELKNLGFDPEHGVDKHFFTRAKKDGKRIVPLETVDFQLGLFKGLTKEESEAMLKETLQEISGFKKMLSEITTAWKTGDAQKLDTLILDAMRDYPEVHKKLLLDRNRQWADKIEKLLAEGKNIFVVVGAAHLVGKDSMVDLLSTRKLKIQQQ